VTLTGGQQYEFNALEWGMLDVPAGKVVNLLSTDKSKVEDSISEDIYLPSILLRDTVSQEKGAHGWVLFHIGSIPKSELRTGTKLVVEFEQSDASKRTVEHVWREGG
jgi:hypothetical protein